MRCTAGDARHRLQRTVQTILNFLSEFEGLGGVAARSPWGEKRKTDMVTIKIHNRLRDHSGPGGVKNFSLNVDLANSTMGDLRAMIASKLDPQIDENYLCLTYGGTIFMDMKQRLRNTKLKESSNLFVTKDVPLDETPGAAIYPMPLEQAQGGETGRDPEAGELENAIEQVKGVTDNPSLEDEFIKYVFKKKYCDIDGTVMAFVMGETDDLREQFQEEEEERRRQFVQEISGKDNPNHEIDEDDSKMAVALANRYFQAVFELLNLNVPEVSAQVWKLLNLIPTNTKMFTAIRDVQYAETPDWEGLLDSRSLYKLLYSLQIVHGFMLMTSSPEETMDAKERENWRFKFLEKGGYSHLYGILMRFEHKD